MRISHDIIIHRELYIDDFSVTIAVSNMKDRVKEDYITLVLRRDR
jgi:hypothetical protein